MDNEIDTVLGALIPESDWSPSISHLLRRAALLKVMENYKPGKLLEIGCGAARILPDLTKMGFSGKAIDSSKQALDKAFHTIQYFSLPFDLKKQIEDSDYGFYDYVLAMEVLEHVEQDKEVLREWLRCLNEGGRFILSVPAFQSKYNFSDRWAGHFRRYELNDLFLLFQGLGFDVEICICMGFPLGNMMRPISNFISKRRINKRGEVSISEATSESGIDRSAERKGFVFINNVLSKLILRLAYLIQEKTFKKNWGTNWLIVAKKKII